MKTCGYWFEFLSEKEQKEYKENVSMDWNWFIDNYQSDFNNFVSCGFIWDRTPQGHDYWSEISKRKIA